MRKMTNDTTTGETHVNRDHLAGSKVGSDVPAEIRVISGDFRAFGLMPYESSAYGNSESPALTWSSIPDGTHSIAVIMEDADSGNPPIVHWMVANIAPAEQGLPFMVPEGQSPKQIKGAIQGITTNGQVGYFGPRPPAGGKACEYHFQVIALDTELPLRAGFGRNDLLSAMKGHVLSWGVLVGMFRR